MADSLLQVRYKILAGTGNREDLLKTVETLADSVADVRFPLPKIAPEKDTIELRTACAAILKDMVDTVRRIRNNSIQQPGQSDDSSDDPV